MKVEILYIDGKKYIVSEEAHWYTLGAVKEGAQSGKIRKEKKTILKQEYSEKLAFLDDDTFYLFPDSLESGRSIYDYCDYLASLEKLKNICEG